MPDQYNRPISVATDGGITYTYTTATPESVTYYQQQRARYSRLLQRIFAERAALDREYDLCYQRIMQAVTRWAKQHPGMTAYDLRHLAPHSRDRQHVIRRRIAMLDRREDLIARWGGRLDLEFQAEIAMLAKSESPDAPPDKPTYSGPGFAPRHHEHL